MGNLNRVISELINVKNYGIYLLKFREKVRNLKEEVLYKPEDFPSISLWELLVFSFGDYKLNFIGEGWLCLSDKNNKEKLMKFLSDITVVTKEELGFYD